MEKIKAALEKVKSQKTGKSTSKKANKSPARKSNDTGKDIGLITYTASSVQKLDPAHLEKHRIVSHLSHNANAGIFDSLRTQVLQKMEENNWQTIAVVSPTPESGKTLVSTNLAISIARQPQKTALLADFDLRRPRIATYLGLDTTKSLNDYLEGKAQLEDVLINPGIQRLLVLPTANSVTGSSETLSSSKVRELIVELKERYDSRIIVFDLPPVLSADDAMVLLPQVDCILMVVANGVSTPTEIEDSLHLIPQDSLVGVIFNKAEVDNKAYYY